MMGKARHILKNLLPGILLLVSSGILAQEEKLNRAGQLYRANQYEAALPAIDSAIKDPQTKNDFICWTTRAYIYYGLYKRSDKNKLNSALRDSVVSSIKMSNSLKPDSDYVANNTKLLNTLANSYFNLSKSFLQDSTDDEKSLVAYGRYKELHRMVEPSFNSAAKDAEYYLAVGSVFSDIFSKDNNNTKAQNTAKVALLKVLEMQPDNPN